MMANPNKPHLFAFDMNSHFSRVFKVQAPGDVSPTGPSATYMGEPVFCLKPLLRLVENEIRTVTQMGYVNTHIVLVFDHPDKNFRHALYPDYKANRPPKPADWRRQEQLMFEMFQSLGFPCLRIAGVEADDVLCTLSHVLSKHQVSTTLFSGDKDIMSCCGEFTQIFAGRENKLYQTQDVYAKFNIPPSRVLDFLALTGDSADNVPGVHGVGPKSAAEILQRYSLDEVVQNPDLLMQLSVRGASGLPERFRQQAAQLQLSRQLVELRKDVALCMNFKDMHRRPPQYDTFLGGFMRPSR